MKMTRLEWRYLQKIALDHPYYDTHKPPLTEAEAKAIVETTHTMTGREFVDGVYQKLGMSRPVKEKERLARLRGIGELFAVPPIRRIAIAVLVIILFIGFFTLTPAGRAMAESAVRYVVRLFGSCAVVSQENSAESVRLLGVIDPDADEFTVNTPPKKAESFAQFTAETGKNPLTLPLSCERIIYCDTDGIVAHATYGASEGRISIVQLWIGEGEAVACSNTEYGQSGSNTPIYYSVDALDGTVSCIMLLDGSVVLAQVGSEIELDALLHLLAESAKQ